MADSSKPSAIPLLRPQLPDTEALIPYLRRIDETRIYSNLGPLTIEFERRMCSVLELPPGGFVAAASGTAALVAAILAVAGRAGSDRPFALIPAFTFVATAAAVEQCGYIPYLADIDETSWALDPRRLAEHSMLEHFGVVVPVAPFGRPQQQEAWRAFRDQTSVPVVFDGAATFDTCPGAQFLGELPVAMSFNATKSFATAEGGAVVTSDMHLTARVRRALNFGFFLSRRSRSPSINGKMSEYHAAVGLAELDGWPQKRSALRDVADRYRKYAAELGIADGLVARPEISSTYVLFVTHDAGQAADLESALRDEAIEWRRWYGLGLHREPYFSELRRERLDATDRVAPTVLGMPVAPDLSEAAIRRVVMGIAQVVGERPSLKMGGWC